MRHCADPWTWPVDRVGARVHLRGVLSGEGLRLPGIVLAVLALLAGALYLLRLREVRGGDGTPVTDEMIERIESLGRVELDDPLDLEQIRDEEVRFWEESFDEPEEL